MLFKKLVIAASLAASVVSQDISNDDIPRQCTAVCSEAVQISRRCDDQTGMHQSSNMRPSINMNSDNDRAELECICRAPNANTIIPTCEACVAQFDRDDDGRNDNGMVLHKRSSSFTSPNKHIIDVFEVLTRCNFTTTTFNSASASNAINSAASATRSGSIIRTTSGTVVLTSSVPAPTGGPAQQSTGGAPMQTAAVGAAMGVVGLAMGLL